jgi:integrase
MTETNSRRARRSPFGQVRQLASGRWHARYTLQGMGGKYVNGPVTFPTKAKAEGWLANERTDRERGTWRSPTAGQVLLSAYSARVVAEKRLTETTRRLYENALRLHIVPFLGSVEIRRLTPEMIRSWYSERSRATGPTAVRQAYALLKTVLNIAITDDLIITNPCRIRGAGVASAPERPHLSTKDMFALRNCMPAHLQLLVELTFVAHLRIGEVLGLARTDFDPAKAAVTISRQVVETPNGPMVTSTKTTGVRTLILGPRVTAQLVAHLDAIPASTVSDRMFFHLDGRELRRRHLQTAWARARNSAGLHEFHFHDLRHAGLTQAAFLGATTREVMARGGHTTMRAAVIYQHVSRDLGRERAFAQRLSDELDAEEVRANDT